MGYVRDEMTPEEIERDEAIIRKAFKEDPHLSALVEKFDKELAEAKKQKEDEEEFLCMKCGTFMPFSCKGKAVDHNDKPMDVCKWCCHEEQERQFYGSF